MSQVTVISGVERRRVWTDEQKRALIAAAMAPGASVADVARRADLRASQIYRWRRDLEQQAEPGFASLVVQPDPGGVVPDSRGIVIELGGAVLRIGADVSPGLAAAVVRSLRR